MKERPITFNEEMIKAILEEKKTQTRRPIKPQPEHKQKSIYCPYGKIGDKLWVKEKHKLQATEDGWLVMYSDGKILLSPCDVDPWTDEIWFEDMENQNWRSPIFMPRWASRIILKITNIRVEKLQNITEKDFYAEGGFFKEKKPGFSAWHIAGYSSSTNKNAFKELWNSIYAKKGFGWNSNPWVWVIEFKKL